MHPICNIFLDVTNVTQLLCKNIIVEQEPVNMHSYYFKVIDIFGTLGLVLGPLIGGYIFEFDKGFIYICVVSAFLSFFSLCVYSHSILIFSFILNWFCILQV